jgi:predicted Zn-ribbon and HTH transcriptional regulator
MPNPRYQPIKVFTRGGRRIVQIKDTLGGRDRWVYQRGESYFEWDRRDARVIDAPLRRVAGQALRGDTSRPAVMTPIKRSPRDCRKCGQQFTPRGPTSKVCPSCRSATARTQTALFSTETSGVPT